MVGLSGLDLASVDLPLAAMLGVTALLLALGMVGVRLLSGSVSLRSPRQP